MTKPLALPELPCPHRASRSPNSDRAPTTKKPASRNAPRDCRGLIAVYITTATTTTGRSWLLRDSDDGLTALRSIHSPLSPHGVMPQSAAAAGLTLNGVQCACQAEPVHVDELAIAYTALILTWLCDNHSAVRAVVRAGSCNRARWAL